MTRTTAFLIPILFLASAAGIAGAVDENLYYRGVVHVKGEIRFRLKGTSFMKNGLIIKSDLYSDPRSVPVLQDDTTVRVDPLEILSYHQVNYSCGWESNIRCNGPDYQLGFRKNAISDFREKIFPRKGLIIPETFATPFLILNLDRLLAGQKISFRFLLPSRFSTIGFTLKKEGEMTVENRPYHVVRLEASSFLVKQFVGPSRFYLQRDPPHRLIYFNGTLTPTDPQGNSLKGTVTLVYGDSGT